MLPAPGGEFDPAAAEALLNALAPEERSFNRQYYRRFGRLNVFLTDEVRGLLGSMIDKGVVEVEVVRPVRVLDHPYLVRPHNADAADTSNVDEVYPGGAAGFDLTGAGVLVGVWDEGSVRETHVDLEGRVVNRDGAGLFEHSTLVAGTVMGSGGGYAGARGMAYEARLWAFSWQFDAIEMLNHGGHLAASNHSYGMAMGWYQNEACPDKPMWIGGGGNFEDPLFGKYRITASDIDGVVRDTDVVSVWSAGNERADMGAAPGEEHYHFPSCSTIHTDSHAQEGVVEYDSLSGVGVAKNVVTVGGVANITDDPILIGDIVPFGYSSFGPADDGRIKPDLVAGGENLTSASSAGDDAYAIYSGTSSSAPTVTGGVALVAQKYRQENGGADPRAAEIKALLIHTAAEAGSDPGPDYRMGFGLFDARAAADLLDQDGAQPDSAKLVRVDVTDGGSVKALQTAESVASGTPLRVTLVWTDPEGSPNNGGTDDATPALVNDLDLTLIAPDGMTEFHPWSLDLESPTAAATRSAPNRVDNVEVVDVDGTDNAWDGIWTVEVNVQGELRRGEPQAYALVSGVPLTGPEGPVLKGPRRIVIETPVGQAADPFPVSIANAGGGTLTWSASEQMPWLSVDPSSGTAPDGFDVIADSGFFAEPGEHEGTIIVSSDDPGGDREIAVLLRLTCEPDCASRACGPDPVCGQMCGRCSAGDYCNDSGQCLAWSGGCPSADLGSQLGAAIVSGTTLEGANDFAGSCGGADADERSFAWTAPSAGTYTFSTHGSPFNTALYLREQTCSGAELGCNDDAVVSTSSVAVQLDAGQNVVAFVDGSGDFDEGEFYLNIHRARCPTGDLGSALGLYMVEVQAEGGSDLLAGSCGGAGTVDTSYLWTAPVDATYWFSMADWNSGQGRALYLLSNSCTGTELGCGEKLVAVDLDQGDRVVIVIDGYGGEPGFQRLNITSPSLTCSGNCEGAPGNGLCFCDASCVELGDCCIDACGLCDTCGLDQLCAFGVCIPDPCYAMDCGACGYCLDGACVDEDDDTSCDDGDPCTTQDFCTAGSCSGTPRVCDDEDPCTEDSCDPGTGECVFDSIGCGSDAAIGIDGGLDDAAVVDAGTDGRPADAGSRDGAGEMGDASDLDASLGDAGNVDASDGPDACVTDASNAGDASVSDTPYEVTGGGCGCTVAGQSRPANGFSVWLALLLAALAYSLMTNSTRRLRARLADEELGTRGSDCP